MSTQERPNRGNHRLGTGRNEPLRLGVIGLSDGNGHPYSWSAIINGYDAAAMATCPFPVIPAYLAERTFPDDQLAGAMVTHVWTQDPAVSDHIAAAARIPNVSPSIEAMLSHVDAVLLARDDAERHVEMALPILRAGLPLYIDKPIATKLGDLEVLFAAERYPGQIFSCSALRYAPSLRLTEEDMRTLGHVVHVDAVTPKSWATYGVHMIDPVLENARLFGQRAVVKGRTLGKVHVVTAEFPAVSVAFTCLGPSYGPVCLRYFGSRGFVEHTFSDAFEAFREALSQFLGGVRNGAVVTTHDELESTVRILEAGAAV